MATDVTASAEIQRIVKGMIERDGAVQTAEGLGISRETLMRIAAGVPVRAGTIALVKQALGK